MSILTVNESAQQAHAGLRTWVQLVAALEQGQDPTRTVVAGVRFEDVDQSTLGATEALTVPLDPEPSRHGELIASAREIALGGLDALAESARRAAEAFRLHDLPRAHRGLADSVQTLQLLTTLTVAVGRVNTPSGVLGLDARGREFLKRLNQRLGALIDFGVHEDWLSLADVLEYEITGLLPQWAALMRDAGTGHARVITVGMRKIS